jgi:hypothetical protein
MERGHSCPQGVNAFKPGKKFEMEYVPPGRVIGKQKEKKESLPRRATPIQNA